MTVLSVARCFPFGLFVLVLLEGLSLANNPFSLPSQ